MRELSDIRHDIDQLDKQLVELLKQRFAASEEIAEVKAAAGLKVRDTGREREILRRLGAQAGFSHEAEIREIYSLLFQLSRERQARFLPEVLPESNGEAFGNFLNLEVFGASHAPFIGVRLKNFPGGFRVDMNALREFLARRAPGHDNLSTARKENDIPEFLSGLKDDLTTGEAIEAIIRNNDARPADYSGLSAMPRPGHADYTQWVQTGRIQPGGGAHSGRMTVALCLAGGLCLQWLKSRGITIEGRLVSAGTNSVSPETEILAARQDGDSVGGVIEVVVKGLPAGLGGPLFQGVENEISAAMFSIPGVKGVEFGGGFDLASRHGSEANAPFAVKDGRISIEGNSHGGLLGGITTGQPVIIRLAMKPTPSIFKTQNSVDLITKTNTVLEITGRHDPCIARRAVPVAEAMAGFGFADLIMKDEANHPRLCLTLTERTIQENLAALKASLPFVDMCELRVDCLAPDQQLMAVEFPQMAGLPVILTIRRQSDGGQWAGDEENRTRLFEQLLNSDGRHFAYVDLEDDFRNTGIEQLAGAAGTRVIRSLHDFSGPVKNIADCARTMRGNTDEIPKIACKVNNCSELAQLFCETAFFDDFPHIICAMGEFGRLSRILAGKTHSLLTYCSPGQAGTRMASFGHLTPETLVRTYGFRQLDKDTELYAVTGWPLEHTLSPELHNSAFAAEGWPARMVSLPAETAAEALACAEILGVRGMAVTIPHKQSIMKLLTAVSPEAKAVGAVNTVVRTASGWQGTNTDVLGFRRAFLAFLGWENLVGHKVAIIGAGGAARAVAFVIAQLGGSACVFNRTLEKAEELAQRYGFQAATLGEESAGLLSEFSEIIVQTTSVGLSSLKEVDNSSDPIPFYSFRGDEKLFELIYSPDETTVMARARSAGCRAENGLTMLLEQAKAQRYFFIKRHMP